MASATVAFSQWKDMRNLHRASIVIIARQFPSKKFPFNWLKTPASVPPPGFLQSSQGTRPDFDLSAQIPAFSNGHPPKIIVN
jgi:hypothetical protein